MKKDNGRFLYSATDLARHLGCTHLTELDRKVADGALKQEFRRDAMLNLLIELGEVHERAYLDSLRAEGKRIVEVEEFGGQASIDNTISAMRQGVDVIAQASLVSLPWNGRADILLKVDSPSKLGSWSYEAADTKLSQVTSASAVLQLCLYTEMIAEIQGPLPARMHVVKPGAPFGVDTLRVSDFMAYFRMVKRRFELHMASGPHEASYPQPNDHCQICNWWPLCNQTWRDDDHLTFVAGISKLQIGELERHGTVTLEAFATASAPLPAPPKRGSLESFAKTKRQAEIQLAGRKGGTPTFEFNEVDEGRGFLRLPAPDPGDVFFDIEGHSRTIGEGLEYLFGYVIGDATTREYRRLWAFTKREEKQIFEEFMQFVMTRWAKYPEMHIYHFAPYEPSALKRLATRHATRENELDQLLRAQRFVDLYAVVRQGIRASVESYSIKKLEPFYRYERLEPLERATQTLRQLERLLQLALVGEINADHLRAVEAYNKDDCLSTAQLRDWLEGLRGELESSGKPLPRPPALPGDPSDALRQQAEETQQVFDQLIADITQEPTGEKQVGQWLLAHMLDYFRREDKCAWWEYHRMHELDHEELLRERKAVAGLQFLQAVAGLPREQTPTHRYSFEPQDVALEEGEPLIEVMGDRIGSVAAIDLNSCTLDIKKRKDAKESHPSAVFAFSVINPAPMPESLLEFGKQLLTTDAPCARYDLLVKHAPRLKRLCLPVPGNQREAAIQLAFDLDNSILPIQGPPGAGKTYIGSHMIAALARQGKRIGVTAVSHKVILNLLKRVYEESRAEGAISVAHQMSAPGNDFPDVVVRLANKDESLDALRNGVVVGGTAWLWSNSALEGELDYLFIDEAGQMSLAMALAAGRAAKNIVLLGDPQQLEQPQQGTHPEGAEISALLHILDGAETMPESKGLFLKNTWRLHPTICKFTSEQYYDGRLDSRTGLEVQTVVGDSAFVGSGLRFVPVEHQDNQNRSDEEVEAIRQIVHRIANGRHAWATPNSSLSSIALDDLLIIAPYNAQVSALKALLPAGARVGTVDKFQGQEAPIVIYSMTSSSAADAPRGMNFLFSRNRMNVATSRARCLVLLVGSPRLFEAECATPQQMRLANGFCRYMEMAESISHWR